MVAFEVNSLHRHTCLSAEIGTLSVLEQQFTLMLFLIIHIHSICSLTRAREIIISKSKINFIVPFLMKLMNLNFLFVEMHSIASWVASLLIFAESYEHSNYRKKIYFKTTLEQRRLMHNINSWLASLPVFTGSCEH